MAAQVIAITAPTGLSTPTLRVFAEGSDTQVSGSPFTLTEATNRKGFYSVSFTGTLAGLHLAVLYTGSSPVGSGWVSLANADGTYTVQDGRFPVNFSAMTINTGGGVDVYSWATTAVSTSLGNPLVTAELPPGAISVLTFTTGAIDANALATNAAQEIADEVLKRSVSNVEASAAEHSLATVILASLESSRSGTTWTIKRSDGTTTHYTKTITTDGAAQMVTGVA